MHSGGSIVFPLKVGLLLMSSVEKVEGASVGSVAEAAKVELELLDFLLSRVFKCRICLNCSTVGASWKKLGSLVNASNDASTNEGLISSKAIRKSRTGLFLETSAIFRVFDRPSFSHPFIFQFPAISGLCKVGGISFPVEVLGWHLKGQVSA